MFQEGLWRNIHSLFFLSSVRVTTYIIRVPFYMPIDDISRFSKIEEPLLCQGFRRFLYMLKIQNENPMWKRHVL